MVYRFPVTLTQLTYFAECARTLNMTTASQGLHVAQSAVSTAITNLERALGVDLFIRQHSKGLVLTPAGENLLSRTQRLFGDLTDTIETIHSEQNEVRGSISVACFNTLTPFLIPDLIDRLRSAHPELQVDVIEGDYRDNMAALRGGQVEIAITYNLAEEQGIHRETLGTARPYIALPEGHALAGRDMVSLAELSDEAYVLLDLPGSSDYFLGMMQLAGVTPRIRYRTSSYETVRSMVAAGLGFSILNQRPRTNRTYAGRRVVAVEIEDRVPALDIAVSSLGRMERSARARVVTEVAGEIMAEMHPPKR